jgi:hypothetical protein
VGAGGEGQAAHGHFEGALAGLVEAAELAQELGGEVRVNVAALVLDQVGTLDAGAQRHSRVVSP